MCQPIIYKYAYMTHNIKFSQITKKEKGKIR